MPIKLISRSRAFSGGIPVVVGLLCFFIGLFSIMSAWPTLKPEKTDFILASAITGSILLVSTCLNNRHSRKLQNDAATRTATEKEKERRHELKKEVSMPLMESLAEAALHVHQMVTIPQEKLQEQDAMQRLVKDVARASVVSSPDVMKHVNAVQKHLTICLLDYMLLRVEVDDVTTDLEILQSEINEGIAESNLMTEKFRRLDETGPHSKEKIQEMMGESAEHASEMQALFNKQSEKFRLKSEKESDALAVVIKNVPKLAELMPYAIAAIREDIGLSPETEWLKEFFSDNADELLPRLKAFHEALQEKLRSLHDPETL